MPKKNDLKAQVLECECGRCRALVRLLNHGAQLVFSPTRAGRLCELAVVAAAGSEGILETEIVEERRAYARHLGVKLSGSTCNSPEPVHIRWALVNSNHNPNAKERINLGESKASRSADRFFLLSREFDS
jgi:hypothetical protein